MRTNEKAYTDFFIGMQNIRWKSFLPVQVPYMYNIKRLCIGKVLDIGCGTGRHLKTLKGRGVGVDHNYDFVRLVRKKGYLAYLPNEFDEISNKENYLFDTILFSHVLEHLEYAEALDLVNKYSIYLKSNGRIVFVVPQVAGYKSDPTHLTFFDKSMLKKLVGEIKFKVKRQFSYPFPPIIGTIFPHNEQVLLAIR